MENFLRLRTTDDSCAKQVSCDKEVMGSPLFLGDKNEEHKEKCTFITAGLMAIIFLLCGCGAPKEQGGTCGNNLSWYYEDYVLTIRGTGDMTYDEAVPWKDLKRYIQQVVSDDQAF